MLFSVLTLIMLPYLFINSIMANFVVEGGKKLSGSISVKSAKNSAVAILCASVLVKGKVELCDMPRIEEVDRILEILQSIGVFFEWTEPSTLLLDSSKDLTLSKINREACEKTRSSLLLLGALAVRERKYKLYKSGGCRLGHRTVRPHLYALEKIGVSVRSLAKYYEVTNRPLKAAEIVMYESGDTPTENAILAAIQAPGKTTIKFASANYMVQDLCYFLRAAGADIDGVGTSTLIIEGGKKFKDDLKYHIMPDPIEAMALLALAIITRSKLEIKGAPMDFLELELEKLRVMGQKFNIAGERFSANGHFNLKDIQVIPSALKALPDKIHPNVFPGINMDHLPFFVPIAAVAKGRTLLHDWVYEDRAAQYLEMKKVGIDMELLDQHRVAVNGPNKMRPNVLACPPAIRPAAALLICMLAAPGKSILKDIYPIERGYENLAERWRAIGANISRVEKI